MHFLISIVWYEIRWIWSAFVPGQFERNEVRRIPSFLSNAAKTLTLEPIPMVKRAEIVFVMDYAAPPILNSRLRLKGIHNPDFWNEHKSLRKKVSVFGQNSVDFSQFSKYLLPHPFRSKTQVLARSNEIDRE